MQYSYLLKWKEEDRMQHIIFATWNQLSRLFETGKH